MGKNFYPNGVMFYIKNDNKKDIYEIIGHDEEKCTYTLQRLGMNSTSDQRITVNIDNFFEEPIGIAVHPNEEVIMPKQKKLSK